MQMPSYNDNNYVMLLFKLEFVALKRKIVLTSNIYLGYYIKVTSKNPFRRLRAQFPPDCVKPPRNAESIASSAFLARQKFCLESVQNRFLEVTLKTVDMESRACQTRHYTKHIIDLWASSAAILAGGIFTMSLLS